jgi:hypothetical protein
MPMNKIVATSEARLKLLLQYSPVLLVTGSRIGITPKVLPPAVILATDTLILPWKGMVL